MSKTPQQNAIVNSYMLVNGPCCVRSGPGDKKETDDQKIERHDCAGQTHNGIGRRLFRAAPSFFAGYDPRDKERERRDGQAE